MWIDTLLQEEKQEEGRTQAVGQGGLCSPSSLWSSAGTGESVVLSGPFWVLGRGFGKFFSQRNLGEALANDHMPLVINDFFPQM